MHKEKSFGVIPLKKDKDNWSVFLVHHQAGHWAFPKGHPEPNESPQETASRELLEETGLTIKKILSDTPLEEHYTFKKEGKQIDKSVTYFLVEVQGDPIIQSEELQGGKWVSLNDTESHVTFPEAKALCQNIKRLILAC